MGETTLISWADKTFNPWVGCQKVGPGCDNCYAEAQDRRWAPKGSTTAPHWGPGAPRRRTSPGYWRQPLKWNEEAKAARQRFTDGLDAMPTKPFVFTGSLCDVFDNAVDPQWRRDLFDLIRATPNLQWLLLTKRPGNIVRLFDETGYLGDEKRRWWPPNAAIGCTVVSQEEADRDVPKLLAAKAALRPTFAFLSMEPLLGPVDLQRITLRRHGAAPTDLSNRMGDWIAPLTGAFRDSPTVDWVIVGGESGPNARPMNLEWARSLRDQVTASPAIFHFKQAGGRGADKGGHVLDGEVYRDRPRIAA